MSNQLNGLLKRFESEIWPKIESDYVSGVFKDDMHWSWGRQGGPIIPKASEVREGGVWLGGILMGNSVQADGVWTISISRQIGSCSNAHQVFLARDERTGTFSFYGAPSPTAEAAETLLQEVLDNWGSFVPGERTSQMVQVDSRA